MLVGADEKKNAIKRESKSRFIIYLLKCVYLLLPELLLLSVRRLCNHKLKQNDDRRKKLTSKKRRQTHTHTYDQFEC